MSKRFPSEGPEQNLFMWHKVFLALPVRVMLDDPDVFKRRWLWARVWRHRQWCGDLPGCHEMSGRWIYNVDGELENWIGVTR